MKKIISLLSSLTLSTTSFSVISCQNSKNEDSNPIFPFPERPTELDKVQELIGYYYDLSRNYINQYWVEDQPKGIKMKESEKFQKGRITDFIATNSLEFIGYQLGQRGGFHFKTLEEREYFGIETNAESFDKWYNYHSKENPAHADWTKTEITKWYNWTLNS